VPERIAKTSQADQDLYDLAVYYLREAGIVVAHRFLDHAEQAFTRLARMPRMGARLQFRKSEHAGIRRWHIEGFPKLIILYRDVNDGIEVIRVLPAARDIEAILSDPA